jgi:hypothetical protein
MLCRHWLPKPPITNVAYVDAKMWLHGHRAVHVLLVVLAMGLCISTISDMQPGATSACCVVISLCLSHDASSVWCCLLTAWACAPCQHNTCGLRHTLHCELSWQFGQYMCASRSAVLSHLLIALCVI